MTRSIGRDRRLVTHPAAGGSEDARTLARRPHVVVVGGGIAGLAAATGLAERGVSVEVIERESYLGGRVGAWSERTDDGADVSMSRGFHAFFRQYYNLRQLLRRTDPQLRRLTALEDYPLIDAHGRVDGFRGLPRTPPWNAIAFALRSPTFRVRDLVKMNPRAAAPLAMVSVPEIFHQLDNVDAEAFLLSINFPEPARHLAFDVFSRSFFAAPTDMSAAELATMFHIYFLGSNEGLVFDVPESAFDTSLWNPLRAYLERLGVEFRMDTTVSSIEATAGDTFVVEHDSGSTTADGVVLSTDVGALRGIVERSPTLGDPTWRDQVARLRSAPKFLVVRQWLDRPVAETRSPFLGTGGLPPLDNISILDSYEREAAEWARTKGGTVVELHAYAAHSHESGKTDGEIRDQLVARLHKLYPETADAKVVHESTLWREDCPLFGLGDFATRPTVSTPHSRLVLAGDGIRIDLPVALMERAATTGWRAANVLLSSWKLAGHDTYTVPTSGRSRPLRWLGTRAAKERT
ncbi:FAD-dependent oxidoreductase [Antrihabitans sp. YC3-6]|uniref:FAD-dependent oxidoreductase n=1 Tax=Antrihabitans stalagmiti TaxID=2799499 RepID=A0A934NM31_9NOCA|nr:FAD-dependent oxidoreductase [Antrihabitans stalagmiti]MBJ8337733.1 FAD-dependent oxidoreductase [Antrihabitans stalagmiti]